MNSPMPIILDLTLSEVRLIDEALLRASARLESLGRANLATAGPHERKATAMRSLRQRLLQQTTTAKEMFGDTGTS
jgi:hypothetical protein